MGEIDDHELVEFLSKGAGQVKGGQFDNQMPENVEMRSKFGLSKIHENKFDSPETSGDSKLKNLTQSGGTGTSESEISGGCSATKRRKKKAVKG